jgi:hypothetical protein
MGRKNLNNAITTVEMTELHRRDLRQLSDQQLAELKKAVEKVFARFDPTPEELVDVMQQLPTRLLYRIVRETDLNGEEAMLVRSVAAKRRRAGEFWAQRVLDLLPRC